MRLSASPRNIESKPGVPPPSCFFQDYVIWAVACLSNSPPADFSHLSTKSGLMAKADGEIRNWLKRALVASSTYPFSRDFVCLHRNALVSRKA